VWYSHSRAHFTFFVECGCVDSDRCSLHLPSIDESVLLVFWVRGVGTSCAVVSSEGPTGVVCLVWDVVTCSGVERLKGVLPAVVDDVVVIDRDEVSWVGLFWVICSCDGNLKGVLSAVDVGDSVGCECDEIVGGPEGVLRDVVLGARSIRATVDE
jgi:hypothetical protein